MIVVHVEIVDEGGSRQEVVRCEASELAGADAERVIAVLTGRDLLDAAKGWLVEKFDDDFGEWIDLDCDALFDGAHIRATKRPVDELAKIASNLDAVEENLHKIVNAIHDRPAVGTPTDTAAAPLGDQQSDASTRSTREYSEEGTPCLTCASPLNRQACACPEPGSALVKSFDSQQSQASTDACDDITCIAIDAARTFHARVGSTAFFIDVRTQAETDATGVIPGALRASRALLEWHTDPENPLFTPALLSGQPLILYAAGNVTEGGRPELAAHTLSQMGVPQVYFFKEGLCRWRAEGLPVAAAVSAYPDVAPVVSLRKTVRDIILEATKSTDFITVTAAHEVLTNPDVVFVDVRSKEEVQTTGVIPGAALAQRELIEWYSNPQSQSHHRLFNPLFGSGKKLVLYGGGLVGGGRPILVSATLRKVLPYHSRVCVLEGGFKAWLANGLATEPVDVNTPEEPPSNDDSLKRQREEARALRRGLVGGGRPILVSATLRKVLPYHSRVCVLEVGFKAWLANGLATEPVDVNTPEEPPSNDDSLKRVAYFPKRTDAPA
ncbi:hypothetical protein DIPPA_13072 [Diplonema papillatum]|nr:hypothetical protein DIPPA_13072 [Diplonema papillatum]